MFSVNNFLNLYTVIGSIFVFLWYYNRSSYGYWRKLNVKYLEPVPFLGNTFKVLFKLAPKHEEYNKFYRALNDEPFGGIYELRKPQLIVRDPELVSSILIKDFKHFQNRGLKQLRNTTKKLDPLDANLMFVGGERWKLLRQGMSPLFTSGKLKYMYEQIWDCINLMTKSVDEQMDGSDSLDVGLKVLFEKFASDVIVSCAFGIDSNSLKSNDKFSRLGRLNLIPRIMVTVRTLLATFSRRLVDSLQLTLMRKEVRNFFLNLTLDTMEYRRQNGVTRSDLLQWLMELQNSHIDPKFAVVPQDQKILENEKFDEIDIAANAFLLFITGFESPSSTLSYCLYELALNQNIQQKVRLEVKQVKEKSQWTYESLRELTYMDAVLSETLRKYPIVPAISRECTEEYVIPGTKTRIPVGTDVVIPIWSIQHDWKYYPNPDVFDPERFMGDNKHSQPSGTFLPFGDGPRFCIGKRFAEMEMKAALSEMILMYDIKPCAKTEIPLKFRNGSALLQSACGTWVNLSKRKY